MPNPGHLLGGRAGHGGRGSATEQHIPEPQPPENLREESKSSSGNKHPQQILGIHLPNCQHPTRRFQGER